MTLEGFKRLAIEQLSREVPCVTIHQLAQRKGCKLVACTGRTALASVNRNAVHYGRAPMIAYDTLQPQCMQRRAIAEGLARVMILRDWGGNVKTLTIVQVRVVADELEHAVQVWALL